MTNKPLVFFGTEDFSAAILSQLIEAGYQFKTIVTKPDTPRGRNKKLQPPAAKIIAGKHNIPVLQPARLADAVDDIAAFQCDYAVLVAYGKIIPGSVLDLFSGGIINVHPSLLPRYRGPSPIESTILHGDATTGVTLMKLVEAMDAGPVYSQVEHRLSGTETRPDLYETLAQKGAALLIDQLPAILSGSRPTPQNDKHATYCSLIKKQDGVIDWHKSAVQLEREVRAYLGWPGSRTQLFNQDVTVLQADVSGEQLAPGETKIVDSQLIIGAGEQSLDIKKLRPAGRSSMEVADFLRGLRRR